MPFEPTPADPLASARRLSSPLLPKRFYGRVDIQPVAEGSALLLDGKPALTPARNPLRVPERLGGAVAAEWRAQGELIDPASMPATRLANTAIDGVASRMAEVRAATLAYGGTDLLCYRAGEPPGLVALQANAWDPVLAWAERRFRVRFVLAEGVMHVAQPERTLAALAAEVARFDTPFRLTGLNLVTVLSGSLLVALAVGERALAVSDAWSAAHVDEDWNISRWGADEEAMRRRARRLADFQAAALVLVADEAR